ncbi:class I SAM-dependent methyltransferase [Sinosporangium siamense]|uniref:Methyltransferase domain-containing protein n=1 Tax=Sinosporangium siamense TaxID=1367973 RepID=A0A919VB81_9ACTN|nr:class I SAM-dependent methyltransferase [Sinosporangium siamense]GII96227.1 hypothetical protein Ssi02_64580 [Sinosporangium siamense]
MGIDTIAELAQRWRQALEAWAIPPHITAQAPANPWTHTPARFAGRTDTLLRTPIPGHTHRRAAEALPAGGTVLDVGAGTGAASLPLLPAADARLTAVDESPAMLAELSARCPSARVLEGRWPDVAPGAPAADVVICSHVVFNVPDLVPFLTALHTHARRRVVVEVPERHPLSWLSPLWEHFHGLSRPTTPTYRDVAEVIAALGHDVHVEPDVMAEPMYSSYEELAASACRRLCLPPSMAGEVAEIARNLGVDPSVRRSIVTLWWDVTR